MAMILLMDFISFKYNLAVSRGALIIIDHFRQKPFFCIRGIVMFFGIKNKNIDFL